MKTNRAAFIKKQKSKENEYHVVYRKKLFKSTIDFLR